MESSSTVSRYVPQNSKKRVFPGGSSSSGCKEVEVLEIPPPINRTPKSKSSKQKEGIPHGIIDVDMEEDDGDVMLIDGDVKTSSKGKGTSSSFPVGLSSITTGASGSNAQTPVNVDDYNPNLFYGEDEWIDTYYDEIVFDDYDTMGSHFDHMDIPPGVEAPFPWLPGTAENYTEAPTTSTSTKPSSHVQSAAVGPSPGLVSYHSRPLKIGQTKTMSTSWDDPSRGHTASVHHVKGKWPSKWSGAGLNQKESTTSSSKGFMTSQPSGVPSAHKPAVEQLYSSLKSKRRSRTSHALSSSYSQYHSGSNFSSIVNNGSSYPTPELPNPAQGLGSYMPMWEDLPMNMFQPSMGSPGFMSQNAFNSNLQGPTNNQNNASPMGSAPSRVDPKNVHEILQKFDVFKKFDTVEDYSDHHYSKNGSSAKQPPKNWAKRIQDEWKILEKDLPDKVFVRVYESRMDLLRAVIVGAEGTPYHDGLYFFDVYFPSNYPSVPPHVHYHSGGLRINPNLYNCGKVCLSLLNTWSGSSKEKWLPGTSTMLQVLVSIQGLILNTKPYFNEPGYASTAGSMNGEKMSLDYNERTFMYSLQTMLYNIRRPPKYFEDFVVGHFCKHGRDILVYCKAYLDGAQVGCLAKGGVQDVDEGDKSCSQQFKNNLAGFITSIVNEFMQIGVKDCQEFLSLAQKATGPPTAAPRNYFY